MTAKIGDLFVDAIKRLSWSAPLKVTSHAIETGDDIAGYVAESGGTLTMECYFADDRLVTRDGLTVDERQAQRVTSADEKRRAVEAMKADKRLVTVTTSLQSWPNMLLIDIQADVTHKNRKGFEPTLVFQQIKTTKTGSAYIPAERLKKKPAAKQTAAAKQEDEQDLGPVAPAEVDDADYKKVAASLLGEAFGAEI